MWWVDGNPVLTTAHPDSPGQIPTPDLTQIRPLIHALGLPFVTSDLALDSTGRWRLVEIGDGQVSDLPPDEDSQALFSALAHRP